MGRVSIAPTSKMVQAILECEPHTRNSDDALFLRVVETAAEQKGISLDGVTFREYYKLLSGNFPRHETVRRTRQKAQEKNPALRACEKVEEYRAENEKEYRAFARGDLNG